MVTIAMSNDPKAREPKWYLNAQLIPVQTLTDGGASELLPKYQRAVVAAIVN